MICVAYTRAVSGNEAIASSSTAIAEQNRAIAAYVKSRKWKIAEKYSDRKQRKDADEAFLQMKADGMLRKFDCVVLASLNYCGRDYPDAYDLLYHTFYPAGIHFAVADDDFFSGEATPEEVKQYFDKVHLNYYGGIASRRAANFSPGKAYLKYGFVWKENGQLEIDAEPAKIIREVYDRYIAGEEIPSIAKDLNQRGVLPPMRYRATMTGLPNKMMDYDWTPSAVTAILLKKMYHGRWERCIRGVNSVETCPAIISEDIYRKAREIAALRNSKVSPVKPQTEGHNIFAEIIEDKESRWPMRTMKRYADGAKIFRLRYPSPPEVHYNPGQIECDYVEKTVYQLLAQEKKAAEAVLKRIEDGTVDAEKKRRIDELRDMAMGLYQLMTENENELVKTAILYEKNGITAEEYDARREQLLRKQDDLEDSLRKIEEKVQVVNRLFSRENPWLALFAGYDKSQPLTLKLARKYIKNVQIFRFREVSLVVQFQAEKDALPQKWFEEEEA